jgi:hypothetical protein
VGKIAIEGNQRIPISQAILPTQSGRMGIALALPVRMREHSSVMPTLHSNLVA